MAASGSSASLPSLVKSAGGASEESKVSKICLYSVTDNYADRPRVGECDRVWSADVCSDLLPIWSHDGNEGMFGLYMRRIKCNIVIIVFQR